MQGSDFAVKQEIRKELIRLRRKLKALNVQTDYTVQRDEDGHYHLSMEIGPVNPEAGGPQDLRSRQQLGEQEP